ncbi:MAG TPA: hypothetical protein VG537_05095 [Candidatus Kapabacteria bacterium]|nr:hypothetical protein [Candidatus Kapabacteria bacterium]
MFQRFFFIHRTRSISISRQVWLWAATMLITTSVRAQLNGQIMIGGKSTNNVESLDTTAPDQILLPAIQLSYTWPVTASSTITFTGAYSPNIYSVNPDLSFNATYFGVKGLFYLTNTDAITAEASDRAENSKLLARPSSHFLSSPLSFSPLFSSPLFSSPLFSSPLFSSPPSFQEPFPISEITNKKSDDDRDDSLVQVAISALYTLSEELDLTKIATKGISKSHVEQLKDTRDSISDALSTIADLLDSLGYSESVAQVVVPELEQLQTPLAKLLPQTKPSHTNPAELTVALDALKSVKPESDFLQTPPTPLPGNVSGKTKQILSSLEKPAPFRVQEEDEIPAPVITLITSSTRLREFGYEDLEIREDADDSGATTLATSLTVPLTYSKQNGRAPTAADSLLFGGFFPGNPNDFNATTVAAAFEIFSNSGFSLRPGYQFTRTVYPFDSVYTNSENRLRVEGRAAIAPSSILFGEFALGFRNYLDPLQQIAKIQGSKQNPDTIFQSGAANFRQYSFGIGFAQFIGERWAAGALATFNNNPNLRAYVTNTLSIAKRRAAPQIADDEYTYNLQRYAIFSNARMFWDIDVGIDFSYEHRLYGSTAETTIKGRLGGIIAAQPGRTENGRFVNVSLSKLFPLETRLATIFNSVMLEGILEVAGVTSSDPNYSYNETAFTLNASLAF